MAAIHDDQSVSEAIAAAQRAGGKVDVDHDGQQVGAVMSQEYLDSLYETLEIASDRELVAAIAEGEADIAAGRTVSLDEVMAEHGLR